MTHQSLIVIKIELILVARFSARDKKWGGEMTCLCRFTVYNSYSSDSGPKLEKRLNNKG